MVSLDSNRIEASFFSKFWIWKIRQEEASGLTCVEELRSRLPHIDAASWPERFALGGVYVNRKSASAQDRVSGPAVLEYYEPCFEPSRAREFFPQFRPEMVIYEDCDMAVVSKPAGLPSYASRDQKLHNLYCYLGEYFDRKIHMPSRLDVGVAGLMLVSFSDRMNRFAQKAYEKGRVTKRYVAELSGSVSWKDKEVNLSLSRDPRHPVLRMVNPELGEHALTRFSKSGEMVTKNGETRTFVTAEPITGRTHQIRVHCQALGNPIVGDPYYGGALSDDLRLVSYELLFHHPYRNEHMKFVLPESLRPEWLAAAREIIDKTGGADESTDRR